MCVCVREIESLPTHESLREIDTAGESGREKKTRESEEDERGARRHGIKQPAHGRGREREREGARGRKERPDKEP